MSKQTCQTTSCSAYDLLDTAFFQGEKGRSGGSCDPAGVARAAVDSWNGSLRRGLVHIPAGHGQSQITGKKITKTKLLLLQLLLLMLPQRARNKGHSNDSWQL